MNYFFSYDFRLVFSGAYQYLQKPWEQKTMQYNRGYSLGTQRKIRQAGTDPNVLCE